MATDVSGRAGGCIYIDGFHLLCVYVAGTRCLVGGLLASSRELDVAGRTGLGLDMGAGNLFQLDIPRRTGVDMQVGADDAFARDVAAATGFYYNFTGCGQPVFSV